MFLFREFCLLLYSGQLLCLELNSRFEGIVVILCACFSNFFKWKNLALSTSSKGKLASCIS